jgi:Fe-S-cluster containining protein
MLNKIRKVERVFKQLDKETEKFGKQSGLKCLTNCNLCCLKKGLEANVLEFMPLALYLVKNNLHEAALDLLDTNPEHCISLAKSQVPGQTAGCSIYEHRGMICRLFGFSGIRDKNSKLAVYTCTHMKNEYPQEFKYAMEHVNSGMNIPLVTDYYLQIYVIDSYLANDYNPINVSIRKAIEKVAYYYSNKPVKKKKTISVIKVEKENAMSEVISNIPDLSSEFVFQASRSSGPGGQNVNKVNSKIELRLNIRDSAVLSENQKEILLTKLSAKINAEGFLIVVSQRDRSQLVNKEDAVRKTYELIEKALRPVKHRKSTKPTRSSIEKRLTEKRIKSDIKQNRQKLDE